MPPRSLADLCLRTGVRHLVGLTSVGDCPFGLVKELLERITSAPQLLAVEENSAQIRGHTAELWQKMIRRDFPEHRTKKYRAKTAQLWHAVYRQYKLEHDAEISAAQAALRRGMTSLQEEKEANVSRTIQGKVASRLRMPDRNMRKPATTGLFATRPRPGKTENSLQKARREAMAIRSCWNNALSLSSASSVRAPAALPSSHVIRAPAAMLNDRRIERQLDPAATNRAAGSASRMHSTSSRSFHLANSHTTKSNYREQQDEGMDDAENDDDGLFDDECNAEPERRPQLTNASRRPHANSLPGSQSQDTTPLGKGILPTFTPIAPTSPPPPVALPESASRKRKTVDIFMRPKKR